MDYKKEAEELRAKADLMDWVADGGEVEAKCGNQWVYLPDPDPQFNDESRLYRKKEKPEYVPFDDSDRDFLAGKRVTYKDGVDSEYMITGFRNNIIIAGISDYHFEYAFENLTFHDGSVFGKIKKGVTC